MKKVLAFQGSPRMKGNTEQLLGRALDGARDSGAETELIRIGSMKMSGCKGCYSCKKTGPFYGKCVLKDDMTPVYSKIEEADAILFGSPVYMCAMTPELKMVIDRLFPYLTMNMGTLLNRDKKTALIFTQNQPDPSLFEWHFNMTAFMLDLLGFIKPEILLSVNTIGYANGDHERFEGDGMREMHRQKTEYRSKKWEHDLNAAYELGKRLADR